MQKNNFSFAILFLICAFLFLFSSCGGSAQTTENISADSVQVETTGTNKLTYEILTEIDNEDEAKAKFKVQLLVITEVPTGSDLATLQSILQKQQNYTGDAKEFLFEQKQSYIRYRPSEGEESAEGMEDQNAYTHTRVEVIYNDNYITTIEFFKEEYAGGVHGESQDLYCVLDLKKNQKMTLDMIFDKKDMSLLQQKITNEALKLAKTEGYTTLQESGYFSEEVTPTENFGVSEKGIMFGYQRGDLAPFMMPPTSFTVAWSELKDIIKADSPVTFFVK